MRALSKEGKKRTETRTVLKRKKFIFHRNAKKEKKLQGSKLIIHDDTGYALTGAPKGKAIFLLSSSQSNRRKNILLIYFFIFLCTPENIERKKSGAGR